MEPRLEVAEVFRQYEQEFLARWGDTLSSHQRKAFRDVVIGNTRAIQICLHPNTFSPGYSRSTLRVSQEESLGV
jgi:hypothetical protein